jgi:predicted NBD/HSP70 family sugar kinase
MFGIGGDGSDPLGRRSLVNDWLASPKLYTAEQEAAHDQWRTDMSRLRESRKDSVDALIPRAQAGDPEAQGVLRSVLGSVGSADPKAAGAWAAGAGLTVGTAKLFGI